MANERKAFVEVIFVALWRVRLAGGPGYPRFLEPIQYSQLRITRYCSSLLVTNEACRIYRQLAEHKTDITRRLVTLQATNDCLYHIVIRLFSLSRIRMGGGL